MKQSYRYKIGMTLVEVILYLALFALFFVVMINFFFYLEDSNQLSGETLKIDRSVIYLSQHFEESVSIADSITDPDLTSGLELIGDSTMTYSVPTDKLIFEDDSTPFQLTRDDLEVTNFSLEEIMDNSDTVIIGIEITVGIRSRSDNSISREFTNSYFLD